MLYRIANHTGLKPGDLWCRREIGSQRHTPEPPPDVFCWISWLLAASWWRALAGPMVTGTFHSGKMETEVLGRYSYVKDHML